MANIHLLNTILLLILVNFIRISRANKLYNEISLGIDDNNQNQCECKKFKCYDWVNEKNCQLLNGKFKPKSLTGSNCNCCSYCVIQSGLFESCYNSIPGFKIECINGSFCSKKDRFVCNPNHFDRSKQYLKYKKAKYIKHKLDAKYHNLNALSKKILNKVPQHERPLKRIPRSPYKLSLRLGRAKKVDNITVDAVEQPLVSSGVEQPLVEMKKKINAISGGNANSINSNIGPTFIINNNYRYSSNQRPVHQKFKMSKDGNLVYETDPNAGQSLPEAFQTTTLTTTTNSTSTSTTTETTTTTTTSTTLPETLAIKKIA